MKNNLENELN